LADETTYCSALTNAIIGNGATSVGDSMFENCLNLRTVVIGNHITSIGSYAFNGCSQLVNLVIPASVNAILDDAFAGCSSLTLLVIPTAVNIIGNGVFFGCTSLTNVNIPDIATDIGVSAFNGCVNLTSITIEKNVSYIGVLAFSSCSNLTSIFFKGNAPLFGSGNPIFGGNTNAVVYYLPGTTGWSSTLDVLPAVLWNPQAQTGDSNFGVRTNRFGFDITGTTKIPIVVEACTNLAGTWAPLQSMSLTNGSFYFRDSQWTNFPGRFYRIRSP
jgi:hypothetical protein